MTLARKDYDQKLLLSAAAEIKALEKALFLYPDRPVEDVYDSLPEAKKVLLEPLNESDEQFVQKWMSEVYEGNPFYDVSTGFETEQGEIVRSKSEWMLANIFHQAGIPYRYEYPVYLRNFGTVYPDFILLNIRLRMEIIWEHLGLMDDEEYLEKAIRKINAYILNGYSLGEDLIITMETKNQPLDVRLVKKLIEKYCL